MEHANGPRGIDAAVLALQLRHLVGLRLPLRQLRHRRSEQLAYGGARPSPTTSAAVDVNRVTRLIPPSGRGYLGYVVRHPDDRIIPDPIRSVLCPATLILPSPTANAGYRYPSHRHQSLAYLSGIRSGGDRSGHLERACEARLEFSGRALFVIASWSVLELTDRTTAGTAGRGRSVWRIGLGDGPRSTERRHRTQAVVVPKWFHIAHNEAGLAVTAGGAASLKVAAQGLSSGLVSTTGEYRMKSSSPHDGP